MREIYNSGNCVIDKQELTGNSTAINAGTFNNIILEDPFRYYSEKILSEYSELKRTFTLVEVFINKERLKDRFLGMYSKYEELMKCFIREEEKEQINLDDGYKSVIACIANVTKHFEYNHDDESFFSLRGNSHLTGKITTHGLEISYSSTIQTYEDYLEATKFAEDLKKKIDPYIICATTYGNFFQFGNLLINEIENVPFIPKKINFQVSNKIIPNLIEPLYGNTPECGLREIIQNACDAMKELSREDEIKSYIELNVQKNSDGTILKVRDYGIGMTEDVLLNKYFVIGESSKKGNDRNLVGQFGIGALAAFLLGNRIAVKTKSSKENCIYSFEYSPDSNENNPIAVSIIQDETFEHGTEVCVDLKKNLSELKQDELEKKLKINEWYVLPDCGIKYFYNNEEQIINSFAGELYEWKSVSDRSEFDIKYLDNKKIEKDGVLEIDHNFKNNPQIIYNGLMVPTEYELKIYYLKKKPFISISSSVDYISLNLERSRIEKGLDLIVDPVKEVLIEKGLEILKEEKNKIVSEDGTILMTTYSNDYFNNIPLFFEKNGFGILSSKYKIGNFVEVYNTYLEFPKVNINDLKEGIRYVFKNLTLDKLVLADFIENNECIIDAQIIEKFFYDATSYRDGFKTETMKYLYKNLFSEDYDSSLNATKFWEEHNKIKENLFKHYFDELKNVFLIPKDKKCEELLRDIQEKTKARVVVYSQYLFNYCDDIFDVGIVR